MEKHQDTECRSSWFGCGPLVGNVFPVRSWVLDAWNYAGSQQVTAQQEQVGEKIEKVDLEAQEVNKVFLAKCWQH